MRTATAVGEQPALSSSPPPPAASEADDDTAAFGGLLTLDRGMVDSMSDGVCAGFPLLLQHSDSDSTLNGDLGSSSGPPPPPELPMHTGSKY